MATTTDWIDRPPPADIEAEMCVLGSVLRDAEVVGDILQILRPEDFYREAHQKIFEAMVHCFDTRKGIDVVLLREELQRRGQLEAVGGAGYLAEVMVTAPSAANAEYYANIVKDRALLRGLIRAARDILRDAYEGGAAADELLDASERRLFQITHQRIVHQTHRLEEIVERAFNAITDRAERGGQHVTGLATGWPELDDITRGLQKGELIVVAARPSMGKTAFALNIAEHVGVEEGVGVAIFSLEQSKEELAQRLLCSRAGIDGHKVRGGFISGPDMARLAEAAGKLSAANIFVDDTAGQTAMDIRAKARRLKAQHHIGLAIVDYLQLVETRGRVENRQQQISEISRSLKFMARELEIPVVALSQLNRSVEVREGHRPRMADLRESGAIEQDADVVLLLHREDFYDKDKSPGEAEIIIAKQRNGPTGEIKLAFRRQVMRFEPLSRLEEPL